MSSKNTDESLRLMRGRTPVKAVGYGVDAVLPSAGPQSNNKVVGSDSIERKVSQEIGGGTSSLSVSEQAFSMLHEETDHLGDALMRLETRLEPVLSQSMSDTGQTSSAYQEEAWPAYFDAIRSVAHNVVQLRLKVQMLLDRLGLK